MDLLNTIPLIQAVKKFIERKCKCHGPTATCSTRTCWDELKEFRLTGSYLKSKYDKAVRVTVKQDGSIVKADTVDYSLETPSQEQLVFLEPSPNYCSHNSQTGFILYILYSVVNYFTCNWLQKWVISVTQTC